MTAGWICLLLGLLTSWIYGLGVVFLCAAFVFAIIALERKRRRHGFTLLFSSLVSIALCIILWFGFLFYWVMVEHPKKVMRDRMTDFVKPTPLHSPR